MSKHTPGPWTVNEGSIGTLGGEMFPHLTITTDFHSTGQITNGPEATVAELQLKHASSAFHIGGTKSFEHRIGPDEVRANAALIAAAPELLEILVAAVGRVEVANAEGNPILSAWLLEAHAIIAKATGKQ